MFAHVETIMKLFRTAYADLNESIKKFQNNIREWVGKFYTSSGRRYDTDQEKGLVRECNKHYVPYNFPIERKRAQIEFYDTLPSHALGIWNGTSYCTYCMMEKNLYHFWIAIFLISPFFFLSSVASGPEWEQSLLESSPSPCHPLEKRHREL